MTQEEKEPMVYESAGPRDYEYVDGGEIRRELAGREMPIPPEWVRRRANVPEHGRYACLSKEIESLYPKPMRDVLVEYIKDMDNVLRYGDFLIIAGPAGGFKRRQWAASAVINEITMRFAEVMDVSADWFSARLVQNWFDAKTARREDYGTIKANLMRRRFLLVEEPQRIPPSNWDYRQFYEAIFSYRFDYQLPTIVTLGVDLKSNPDAGWNNVEAVLGSYLAELLRSHDKYLAHA